MEKQICAQNKILKVLRAKTVLKKLTYTIVLRVGSPGRRYRIRPYVNLPAFFDYLRNRRYMVFWDTRASASYKQNPKVIFKPLLKLTKNVKWLPIEVQGYTIDKLRS